jgi:hypothetical protein
LFCRKELLSLAGREPGRDALLIVATIKIVYVFLPDIKGSCPGLFGFRTVKYVMSGGLRIKNEQNQDI